MTFKELEQQYQETAPEKSATFMNFARKAWKSGEMSMAEVMNALARIADADTEECRIIGRKGAEMTYEQRQRLTMAAKLVAGLLVLLCESRSKNETRSRALLFLEYASYLNNYNYDLMGLAVMSCSYAMTSPGFSWSMTENAAGIDMLTYKMRKNASFDKNQKLEPILLEGKGSVSIADGLLRVSSTQSWEKHVKAYSCHGDTVEVCTHNVRDEKLKASAIDNVESMNSFAHTFMMSQKMPNKARQKQSSHKLSAGERYTIMLGSEKEDGERKYFECTPLKTNCEETCELHDEELVTGIRTNELSKYLYSDDCIKDALLIDDRTPMQFSIKDAYMRYSKAKAAEDMASKRVYEAKVLDIYYGHTPDKDRVRLISDKGYGGLMRLRGQYKKDDIILVHTVSVIDRDNKLFINMDLPLFDYREMPGRFDEENLLDEFILTKDTAMASQEMDGSTKASVSANAGIVRQLGTIMSLTKAESSVARYRDLLTSAFMLGTAGDTATKYEILSRAEFMRQCLRIAEGLPAQERSASYQLAEHENRIIKALGYMDTPEDIYGISALLQDARSDSEKEIARLLMTYSLSLASPDDIKPSETDIRRRICGVLGVKDHLRDTGTKEGGKYGKGELADVEFKASYVMSNVDGKPDLYRQGRGQVFEAVCGFLNKDGGTVYIGVNNYGDPITAEGYGLDADLKWFRDNFSTVKMQRIRQLGHPVPLPKDLDSYCLFLNDEMELYFKPSVRNCITITPTEDMDAIKIIVKPSEFEIAKLYTDNKWKDGTVYVRKGGETCPMSRQEQEERLMKLRSVGKIEQFILTLSEAIDRQRKVILKGYASSNSNEVKDRFVVPINLVYDNEILWAYDLENKEAMEFRLSRISSIDTDIEDARYSHAFEKGEADVFRQIDPKFNYHIKLKISIAALNNLRENFSNAKHLPENELYLASPKKWILDTTLHSLDAAARFYLSYADQIEIMETEDADKLRTRIRDFINKNIMQEL